MIPTDPTKLPVKQLARRRNRKSTTKTTEVVEAITAIVMAAGTLYALAKELQIHFCEWRAQQAKKKGLVSKKASKNPQGKKRSPKRPKTRITGP
jgi:molybdenum cofactor biosynthesis enzyme